MVCHSIGMIEDGEDIIEATQYKFASQFKDEVLADVLAEMHALFKLDDPHAKTIEDELINHGGEDALDHDTNMVQSA
ncbi:hypothetical protein D1007_24332 [Hordeum vulgare]|nr:hypothetical protein D1007_24332 [Hordeum vulgare]